MQIEMLAALLFLPLFPLTALPLLAIRYARYGWLRVLIILAWPQAGLSLIEVMGSEVPDWIITWAIASALFYAIRVLVVREVTIWLSFMSVSAWALLWLSLLNNSVEDVRIIALGFSVPLALLALLSKQIESRFGAAYAGLQGGMARSLPRLSGLLVVVVLAITATPVFPSFFAMLSVAISQASLSLGIAVSIVTIWLVWTWAGARLIQGLVIGEDKQHKANDLSSIETLLYVTVILGLVVAGLYFGGSLS